jgi:hypothetical protein
LGSKKDALPAIFGFTHDFDGKLKCCVLAIEPLHFTSELIHIHARTGNSDHLPDVFDELPKSILLAQPLVIILAVLRFWSIRSQPQAIEAAGAVPYISFKTGSIADNGCEVWRKMVHFYQFKRSEFLAHYHKRSNAETTFSMLKRSVDQVKDACGPDQRSALQGNLPQSQRSGAVDLRTGD